jgi:exodeoxyribonuclease V alpha subunit
MSAGVPSPSPERDPFDPRLAVAASGPLREFNRAGVLSAADVHVARRLGALGGETDDRVLLAVALAVRAPRIGHVLVDLASIRETVAVDTEDPLDLDVLLWPEVVDWVAAVAGSPLVAAESVDGDLGDGASDAGPADEAADPVRPLRLRGTWLYLDRYWAEEIAVADTLRSMLTQPAAGVDEARLQAGLARLFADDPDGRQAAGAAAALRRRFAVVAGGPGTGKTTTVARIAALLAESGAAGGRAPLVALSAPTGKAAARLRRGPPPAAAQLDVAPEVRDALLGLHASTIHRLLGWRPDSSSRFRHDRHRRLPHDVVIVDETSMVSQSLMSRLIEALRSDARLVLVGDPGQLASIEAGAVLGDIVGSADGPGPEADSESIVVLDRGHRFGGAIASLAAAIRAGDADQVIALLRAGSDDVVWVDCDASGPQAAARVRADALAAATSVLDAAQVADGEAALGALSTFRMLCAHRRGPYGVANWNARVEGWLQEAVAGFSAGERWYVGRPLLVTENDYELGLANGDTGVVVDAGAGRVMACFDRGSEAERGRLYSSSRLGAVDTVYAMTIHKSQGSQFRCAAVLLPEAGSRILTRELLYTAATRAQERLILVGPEQTIRAAVARRVARASGLATRLWG